MCCNNITEKDLQPGTNFPVMLDKIKGMKFFDPHVHMTSRTTDDYQAMADAGIVEAAVSHTAVRTADGEAASSDEPPGGRRRHCGHRLQAGRRPLLRLEGRADMVTQGSVSYGGLG